MNELSSLSLHPAVYLSLSLHHFFSELPYFTVKYHSPLYLFIIFCSLQFFHFCFFLSLSPHSLSFLNTSIYICPSLLFLILSFSLFFFSLTHPLYLTLQSFFFLQFLFPFVSFSLHRSALLHPIHLPTNIHICLSLHNSSFPLCLFISLILLFFPIFALFLFFISFSTFISSSLSYISSFLEIFMEKKICLSFHNSSFFLCLSPLFCLSICLALSFLIF